MIDFKSPIGVADSGVGGLSVVRALRSELPHEDILYFGDTANCPYGNKTEEHLLMLSGNMLSFLEKRNAKCIALACNTTSALAPQLRMRIKTPIITIAECAANAVSELDVSAVGVIATKFTIAGGIYNRCIQCAAPGVAVYGIGSANLASLVERGAPDAEIDSEIRLCMDQLLKNAPLKDVILGCTHYPLVMDRFQACYPELNFIDPAPQQAIALRKHLQAENLLAKPHRAKLTIFTTGDTEAFRAVCKENGFDDTYDMEFFHI